MYRHAYLHEYRQASMALQTNMHTKIIVGQHVYIMCRCSTVCMQVNCISK